MYKRAFRIGLSLISAIILLLSLWSSPAAAFTQEQQLVQEVGRIINRAYVDATFNHQNWLSIRQAALKQSLENREATYAVIQNMLSKLDDPFTRLLKPDQYRSLQVNTSGELTGVGLQIALEPETKRIEVIAPLAGSPAEQAGIKPGDRILQINNIPTTKLTLDEAAAMMRGPTGTSVTLTIQHSGESSNEIQLVRSRIALNPVYAKLDADAANEPIGYIRLSQFSANAPMELAHAVKRLEKEGAQAYILDLRNNPGGLLQAGIEIARMWLDQGPIVYTVNRQGIVGGFEASESAITHAPLVVLVNQGTASASEILAGALQDNGRAQLVGEKTFGKGLIQSLFDLADGAGLAVTVAKYETPNHHDINKLGIQPNQLVAQEPITIDQVGTKADQQYHAAVELLNNRTVVAGAA